MGSGLGLGREKWGGRGDEGKVVNRRIIMHAIG